MNKSYFIVIVYEETNYVNTFSLKEYGKTLLYQVDFPKNPKRYPEKKKDVFLLITCLL